LNDQKDRKRLYGSAAVIITAILFGIMPVFSKQLLQSGVTAQSLVFLRFAFTGLLIPILMRVFKAPFYVTKRQLFHLFLFGIMGGAMTAFLLYSSYLHMPIGIATMLHFGYPLFVMLIMIFGFREKCTFKKVAAGVLALGGMVLLADLRGDFSFWGVFYAVFSGLTIAIYVVASRKSSFRILHPMTVVFYMSLFSSLFLGVWIFTTRRFTLPTTTKDWWLVFILVFLCTILPHCLFTFGIQRLGATPTAIINMLEPLTTIIVGAWVFGEIPGFWPIIGGILICACIVLIVTERSPKESEDRLEQAIESY
jgi:drug/metabolite transporter (DMT)-like permease